MQTQSYEKLIYEALVSIEKKLARAHPEPLKISDLNPEEQRQAALLAMGYYSLKEIFEFDAQQKGLSLDEHIKRDLGKQDRKHDANIDVMKAAKKALTVVGEGTRGQV